MAANETTPYLGNVGPSRVPTAEIDTSSPFESVRQAVDRFGGSAQWNSHIKLLLVPQNHHIAEEVDVLIVEKQAAQLEKDLIIKERETTEVLKELEITKIIVNDLKSQLQKEASLVSKVPEKNSDYYMKVHPVLEAEEFPWRNFEDQLGFIGPGPLGIGPKQSPAAILMELKKAKVNLNRTTSDLAGIRSSVELHFSMVEKEKALLHKTQENLTMNKALAISLEEELNQTTLKLQETRSSGIKSQEKAPNISEEINRLSSEIAQFRKMKDFSTAEVLRLTKEIEQMKASIKTAEIRWLAAKKMTEAAKGTEDVANGEKTTASTQKINYSMAELQTLSEVTLSTEEYAELTRRAQKAEEISRKKIEASTAEVEEANHSKLRLLAEVEKAEAEAKASRKALEEALLRLEAADSGKLAVEEALRSRRSKQGQRKRHIHGSPKFKNSSTSLYRRDSRMLDLNGLSLVTDVPRSSSWGTRSTLSIGQILSRKLTSPEAYDTDRREKINARPRISLGQMLSRKNGALSPQKVEEDSPPCKQHSARRKKLGLVGRSLSCKRKAK